MKAVVFHSLGDIRIDEVKDPKIHNPSDAIVKITSSAICGTDLHFVRGTMPGMRPGTILGHEGVGIVEEVGSEVRNLRPGDRVVIPSTIGCGFCSYCRAGYYAQCDRANPNLGTAFFGGPESSGPFHGLQAEKARIPFASTGLVKLPDEVSDDQAILLSDIFPTGYFGAELAEIKHGDTVAVFGCGLVGLFSILSAKLMGAGRIFAVDTIPTRLAAAQLLGAEIVDYNVEHPVEVIHQLTGGIGVDRAIDAVGVDANHPDHGPGAREAKAKESQFQLELQHLSPKFGKQGDHWHPGNAPSQVLRWAIDTLAKAGSLSIVGAYPHHFMVFPIGQAVNKNITVKMGNCNHRRYIPHLIELVKTGAVDPAQLITQQNPISSAIEAYQSFDLRKEGWVKVELIPGAKKVA